jgi:hypothetical protein
MQNTEIAAETIQSAPTDSPRDNASVGQAEGREQRERRPAEFSHPRHAVRPRVRRRPQSQRTFLR